MMLLHKKALSDQSLGFVQEEDGSLRIDEEIVIPPPPVPCLSHDVPERRLIISKLKIKNFKSYANEIVLGPFDKNLTNVVGPNGSGKSNVIDALLFVFGYRAKKIRSKKISELIHKSTQYPDLPSCTVTVTFNEIRETGDSYQIIENTEFVLSRTVNRDDVSYYKMDNKPCQFNKVAARLRKYGIDLNHSRFLILQGEIEAIAMMPPKGKNEHETGMLEYVEDIIGSNRYIEPLKQFEEKIKKIEEVVKEKQSSLRLVEKEKNDLEGPKEKALSYLRLENQIYLKENSLLQYKKHMAEKDLEEAEKARKDCSDRINELRKELNEFKASRKTQEDNLSKISNDLETHKKNYEKFKETFKELERKDVQMAEQIKHLKSKKSNLISTLDSTQQELAKQKKKLTTHEEETIELTKKKEKLEKEYKLSDEKLSQVMKTMNCETDVMQEKVEVKQDELVKLESVSQDLKNEKNLLEGELRLLTKSSESEKKRLQNMIASLETAEKNAKEENAQLKKEENQLKDLEAEYNTILIQKMPEYQQKERELTDKLNQIQSKYDEAKTSLTSYRSQSDILRAFNEERAKGRFQGVFGRLGDLGAIDQKYDVAISTAVSALDSILTDNMNTAQQCVEYLKKHNLGRAHFIGLDQQKHLEQYARRKFVGPENAPRLIDLIRVREERFLPAFYFAMRDTLVAKDLDQATRIGLQGSSRYRVVTLKGEVIELAGTMSGGGRSMIKGKMGAQIVTCTHTPQEVELMDREINNLTKNIKEVKLTILNMQQRISDITKEKGALKLSLKKRTNNYQAYQDSVEMLKTQVEEQEKKIQNCVVDEKEIADLKNRIMEKEKCYNVSAAKVSACQEELSKLQNEIMKITKGTMGKAGKVVEKVKKEIAECSQNITKSSVLAKNFKKNIKKSEEKIKNLENEIESIGEKKANLEAERDKFVAQGKECKVKEEEAQAAVDELSIKYAELKKELKTYEDKEHQIKVKEINLKNELKDHEARESENRSAIRSFTARINKMKLNEVENDSTEIPVLSVEEIEKIHPKRLQADIDLMRVQLEEIQPNLSAIAEFNKKLDVYNAKKKEYDEVNENCNLQNTRLLELKRRRLTEFMNGFSEISKKLKEIYMMLTLGGDAELEVVDKFDTFNKGVDLSIRPPRKSWKQIANLSGGEKTLSSLSLVFALHYYRPTPFYVMDEIDAALDIRNVAIVGFFLKERQKNTQFIIVSLRNVMNEMTDHLLGIYKVRNTSKSVSLRGAGKWKEEDEELDRLKRQKNGIN